MFPSGSFLFQIQIICTDILLTLHLVLGLYNYLSFSQINRGMLAVGKNRYLLEASEGLWKGRPAITCVHKYYGQNSQLVPLNRLGTQLTVVIL